MAANPEDIGLRAKEVIWNGLLDAEREHRYYAALADEHERKASLKWVLQGLAGLFASLSFAGYSAPLLTAGGITLLSSIILPYLLREKAEVLRTMAEDASFIETKYRTLWELAADDRLNEEGARRQHELLEEMLVAIGNRTHIRLNVKANEKAARDIYQRYTQDE